LNNCEFEEYILIETNLRRIIMKALKPILLVVALLSVLIIAGCQESYTSQNFAWEQGQTGFWQPDVAHIHSGYGE
jgi:hypothetical protein